MNIPEIVRQHVLENCGRMPETQEEIDQYLDLINHGKEYADSLILYKSIGKRMMKKYGLKTPDEIKQEGKKLFQPLTPSKAKEIIDRYGEYLVKEFKNEPSVDKWLATPEAAALLSGEDWKEDASGEQSEKCNHNFIEYKQCCYCGAFENYRGDIVEKRTQSNVEQLRTDFSEWYFSIKNQIGHPPLAMQIFYWFDKNLGIFNSLTDKHLPKPTKTLNGNENV